MVEKQYGKLFQEHAQVIGVVLALFAATSYAGGSYISLKKDIALVRGETEKEIAVIRAQAKRKLAAIQAQTEKDIVQPKKKTVECFLMYGYAEEFCRYPKLMKPYKKTRAEGRHY